MKTARLVAALLAVAPLASGAEVERPIEAAAAGKVVATLDAHVYEHARPDLGDLRLWDDKGAEVPYLLQRIEDEPPPSFRQPAQINRGQVRGVGPTATLSFERPVLKSELVLSLSGDNFRRRVVVEGRGRGETEWTTLTDGAYVFALPGDPAARYEAVRLPENNYPYLKITVHRGPDEKEPVRILDVWVRPQERRRPREVPLDVRWSRAEDAKAKETLITLDLGARHRPFRAVVLEAPAAQFFRGVGVEARREPAPHTGGQPWWQSLAEGCVYRFEREGAVHEGLRLDVSGRERVLRLRIRNRDDRPLAVSGVKAMVPVERLVFEADAGRRYRLAYGDPGRAAPYYDLRRTVGDPALWIAQAAEAVLGAASERPEEARRQPWTERHPILLWAGLVTLVAALGGITWRAVRS